jgi:hypothetical protein
MHAIALMLLCAASSIVAAPYPDGPSFLLNRNRNSGPSCCLTCIVIVQVVLLQHQLGEAALTLSAHPSCSTSCLTCVVAVQVVLLQRQLGEALAELQANRDRLAEAEAIQVRLTT